MKCLQWNVKVGRLRGSAPKNYMAL